MKKNMKLSELTKVAKDIALLTLEVSYLGKTGHVGSALSISDLLTGVYFSVMNISKTTLTNMHRDRFILSKGHAAAALYAVLYKKGILTKKQFFSFGQDEGGLCEHPDIADPGIEMSTGSLGHGLPFSVGIALGLKKHRSMGNVYVLISDGECSEGSIWEAALLAGKGELDNLVVLLDYNRWQCFDKASLDPVSAKWEAFGWDVQEIDGHDMKAIVQALKNTTKKKGKPHIIVAHTVSGKGISLIEDTLLGHYKVFAKDEYESAREELMNR
jgi:transketolase